MLLLGGGFEGDEKRREEKIQIAFVRMIWNR